MKSRYDYMSDSEVTDIDNEKFPDPLSATYNDVQFTQVPVQSIITDKDITKFWLYMKEHYGTEEMDDVLLNINGIPYLGSLRPGNTLFLVDYSDLNNFNEQKLGSVEE